LRGGAITNTAAEERGGQRGGGEGLARHLSRERKKERKKERRRRRQQDLPPSFSERHENEDEDEKRPF
jgi:hypothetical protein